MFHLNRLMAFLATADAERSKIFYRDMLGLALLGDEPGALVFAAGETVLRVQEIARHVAPRQTALGWCVENIAAAVVMLEERGVRFVRHAGMLQDERGVWTAPSGAKVAWFEDPDGNVLSLTETPDRVRPTDNVVPEICVDDGLRALAFYVEAFGAVELQRMLAPDGKRLMHGEIRIAGHRLFVIDEFRDVGTCRCPKTLGGTGVRVVLEVRDADAFVARACAAGASVVMPVTQMFWGARYAKLIDPFGHEWGINQQQELLSPEAEVANARRHFANSE
jgi:PhnB protein